MLYESPHQIPSALSHRILENWEILEKSQMWVEMEPSVQSSSQKLNFCNTSQKIHKSRYQSIVVCPILLNFFTLLQIFCPRLSTEIHFWS